MNGKGDRNRSLSESYREGWERIFGAEERAIGITESTKETASSRNQRVAGERRLPGV